MKFFIFLIFFLFSTALIAQQEKMSSHRKKGESFRKAYIRNYKGTRGARNFNPTQDATSVSVPYKKFNTRALKPLTFGEHRKIHKLFKIIRDTPFLKDQQDNKRRISWLYPQDGCFARAEAIKNFIKKYKLPIMKVFSFGNLTAKTFFAQRGYVNWWYHVAVIYKTKKHRYVIDPSLNPYRPLKLEKWINLQSTHQEQVRLSLCHPDTYKPSHSCFKPKIKSRESLKRSLKYYVEKESRNLKKLGYSLKKELGPLPYWKRSSGLLVPDELKKLIKLVESFR